MSSKSWVYIFNLILLNICSGVLMVIDLESSGDPITVEDSKSGDVSDIVSAKKMNIERRYYNLLTLSLLFVHKYF